MKKLLASSGSKEELEKSINEFYLSENCIITDDNRVYNKKLERFLDGVIVIVKKNRWRFEMV